MNQRSAGAFAAGRIEIRSIKRQAHLNSKTAVSMNGLVIRLKKELNITSVAVTHDMASAYKISDRIAMLHDGRIIGSGTPDEIKDSSSEIIQQFISGKAEGPIINF